MDGVLSTQRNFKALESDVLLITTPKSDTTWLKTVLFALINRPSYSRSSDHPLLSKSPHELVPFLEIDLYVHNHDPDLSSLTSPRLFSTHLSLGSLPESVVRSKYKLVYLCRNPKDTFVSLWNFINQMRLENNLGANPMEEASEMFCRGVSMFGPLWDNVLGYYKASLKMPNKVMFLKYEDMKERPVEELRRVAGFLGCPFSENQDEPVNEILRLCSFDRLSRLEVNQNGKLYNGVDKKFFFRKGQVGDWINNLSPEMAERLDRITEERFSSFGLKL
ncbi:hypothetical protein SAY86_020226 [Trapa natans]|uniref:Sulfotransferase n=1 Tax=Trapa natans TaxID=22666 RepID=A0AAN7LMJ1_TRANT|nr:hypothetical protein SAY86_020226 [Trapa natans]